MRAELRQDWVAWRLAFACQTWTPSSELDGMEVGITFAALWSSGLSVSPLRSAFQTDSFLTPIPHCCHLMVPFGLPALHPQYPGLNAKPPLPGLWVSSAPPSPSLFLLAALLFSSWLVHLLQQVLELPCPLEGELPRVRGWPSSSTQTASPSSWLCQTPSRLWCWLGPPLFVCPLWLSALCVPQYLHPATSKAPTHDLSPL